MKSLSFAIVFVASCAYLSSASAGNVQIQVLDRNGKPVPDAVVVLYPSAGGAAAPNLLPATPTIEQERMRFVPAVTVVAAGTTVRFTNQDRWDHHVRGVSASAAAAGAPSAHAGHGANTAQGSGGQDFEFRIAGRGEEQKAAQSAQATLAQPGVMLLSCHLHGSMRGHVFVTDSPWTIKTDVQGHASFPGVPEGAAQVRVWHPEQLVDLPRKSIQVQTAALQDTMQLGIVPRPPRRESPAPAAAPSGGYGSDYKY